VWAVFVVACVQGDAEGRAGRRAVLAQPITVLTPKIWRPASSASATIYFTRNFKLSGFGELGADGVSNEVSHRR